MNNRIATGQRGEEAAAAYLRKNGYKIIGRNVRNCFGEIDIVASDRGVICFVEVRSRSGLLKRGEALASIDSKKQKKISKAALGYLQEKKWEGRRARFDVVALDGEDHAVLLKDAFPVTEKYR